VRYERRVTAPEAEESRDDPGVPDGAAAWDVDLTATLALPHSFGAELNVRSPLGISGHLALGYAPPAFIEGVVALANDDGTVDRKVPIFSFLLPQLVRGGGWVVRAGLGASVPCGAEIGVGYSLMYVSSEVSPVTVGRLVSPSQRVTWTDGVVFEIAIHALHVRVGWRFVLPEDFVLRLALGWVQVLDATLAHDIGRAFRQQGDVATRTQILSGLITAPIESWGFTPEALLAIGRRF
jgi:hypothetical protein